MCRRVPAAAEGEEHRRRRRAPAHRLPEQRDEGVHRLPPAHGLGRSADWLPGQREAALGPRERGRRGKRADGGERRVLPQKETQAQEDRQGVFVKMGGRPFGEQAHQGRRDAEPIGAVEVVEGEEAIAVIAGQQPAPVPLPRRMDAVRPTATVVRQAMAEGAGRGAPSPPLLSGPACPEIGLVQRSEAPTVRRAQRPATLSLGCVPDSARAWGRIRISPWRG